MELSEAQKEKVRYYCGYGMYGLQALPASGYRFSVVYGTLEYKMINLQAGEYDIIVNTFLVELPQLESDLFSARSNLDTAQAAVWYWNKNELRDRRRLYNMRRLDLCAFLGIPPGESLPNGGGLALCI
jgi:hypothetical protein